MSMILGLYNYWIVIVLMMIGFYIIIAHGHLIKKIVGLNIFQTSVFIFYISLGKVEGGTAPIWQENITLYSNPSSSKLVFLNPGSFTSGESEAVLLVGPIMPATKRGLFGVFFVAASHAARASFAASSLSS